jgi:hypothetical protein
MKERLMKDSKSPSSRRKFLLAFGAGSAATVAAIAAKTTPEKVQSGTEVQPQSSGYRLSEHIRNYYRTTLV